MLSENQYLFIIVGLVLVVAVSLLVVVGIPKIPTLSLQARLAASSVAQFDTNGNGKIDRAEMERATDQYVAGQISDTLYFQIIDAFDSQISVRGTRGEDAGETTTTGKAAGCSGNLSQVSCQAGGATYVYKDTDGGNNPGQPGQIDLYFNGRFSSTPAKDICQNGQMLEYVLDPSATQYSLGFKLQRSQCTGTCSQDAQGRGFCSKRRSSVGDNGEFESSQGQAGISGTSFSSVAQFDTNGNGKIEDAEYNQAIDAWVDSQIGDDLFFRITDTWLGQGSTQTTRDDGITGDRDGQLRTQRGNRGTAGELRNVYPIDLVSGNFQDYWQTMKANWGGGQTTSRSWGVLSYVFPSSRSQLINTAIEVADEFNVAVVVQDGLEHISTIQHLAILQSQSPNLRTFEPFKKGYEVVFVGGQGRVGNNLLQAKVSFEERVAGSIPGRMTQSNVRQCIAPLWQCNFSWPKPPDIRNCLRCSLWTQSTIPSLIERAYIGSIVSASLPTVHAGDAPEDIFPRWTKPGVELILRSFSWKPVPPGSCDPCPPFVRPGNTEDAIELAKTLWQRHNGKARVEVTVQTGKPIDLTGSSPEQVEFARQKYQKVVDSLKRAGLPVEETVLERFPAGTVGIGQGWIQIKFGFEPGYHKRFALVYDPLQAGQRQQEVADGGFVGVGKGGTQTKQWNCSGNSGQVRCQRGNKTWTFADSDQGIKPDVTGQVVLSTNNNGGNTITQTDMCVGSSRVNEWYLDTSLISQPVDDPRQIMKVSQQSCPGSCQDGKCLAARTYGRQAKEKTVTGKVQFTNIEGGCFYLQTDNGRQYELLGFNQPDLINKRVEITGRERPEAVTTCQIGINFQVSSVRQIEQARCPSYAPISPLARKACLERGGRIVTERDARGCPGPPHCSVPEGEQVEHEIILKKGWNLIGLGNQAGKLVDPNRCLASKLRWYNPTAGKFQDKEKAQALSGYFVQSSQEGCRIGFTNLTDGPGTLNLKKGWNTISADGAWNDIKGTCQLSDDIFAYNPEQAQGGSFDEGYVNLGQNPNLISSDNGVGYFVKVAGDCQLDLSGELQPPGAGLSLEIDSIAPQSGPIGTTVELQGTFAPTGNDVHFGQGGIPDLPSSNGVLTFQVPAEEDLCVFAGPRCRAPVRQVQPGQYKVWVSKGKDEGMESNRVDFTVTEESPTPPGDDGEVTEIQLILKQGWNLIGLGNFSGTLTDPNQCLTSPLRWYVPSVRDFVDKERTQAMGGYFLQAGREGCQAVFTDVQAGPGTLNLKKGWNTISADGAWNDIKGTCQLSDDIFAYNPEQAQGGSFDEGYVNLGQNPNLISSDNGVGYFVKVAGDCQISQP